MLILSHSMALILLTLMSQICRDTPVFISNVFPLTAIGLYVSNLVHGVLNSVKLELVRNFLLHTATWTVSSQGIQDHFGAKSANWLAGYRKCKPRFQFHQVKP